MINKKKLKDQLELTIKDAEAKTIESSEVKARIESAQGELNDRSENIIKRLFSYRRINELKNDIQADTLSEGKIAQELADLKAAQDQIETLTEDRSLLQNAKQKLDDYYQRTDEAWNNYEDDRQAGNIGELLRQRDVLLVHAFQNPVFSPSEENGVLRKEIKWHDKLDLLIALEPSISASAVDQHHQKTFAPVGVVLGDGQVTAASARDMGTRVADRNSRYINNTMGPERVRAQIETALDPQNAGHGWTEFVVNEPKVAGIFFRIEPDGRLADLEIGSDTNIVEVVAAAQERNLPIFALQNGSLYKIEVEEALALGKPIESTSVERVGLTDYKKTKQEYPQFEAGRESAIASKELADIPNGIDPMRREAILERFMGDSPFKLNHFPEALQVESRAEGKAWYALFARSLDDQDGQKVTIPAYSVGNIQPLEVTMLTTIQGPTSSEHIVRLDDGSRAIWEESRHSVGERSRFRAGSTYQKDWLRGKESTLSIGGCFVASRESIKTIEDLMVIVKKEFDKTAETLKGDTKHSGNFLKEYCTRISSFLYGLAEEARKAGDIETADEAEQIASQVLSADDYRDIVNRRVSENGTFRLTREELLGNGK